MVAAGTTVLCLKRHTVGTLAADLNPGDTVLPRLFNYATGQGNIAGEALNCKICGRPYSLGGNVYTDSGWQPGTPSLEQPPYRR